MINIIGFIEFNDYEEVVSGFGEPGSEIKKYSRAGYFKTELKKDDLQSFLIEIKTNGIPNQINAGDEFVGYIIFLVDEHGVELLKEGTLSNEQFESFKHTLLSLF